MTLSPTSEQTLTTTSPRCGDRARTSGSSAPRPRTGLRVLVVDDHDVFHLGFRLLLVRSGVRRCVPARDAEEALAAARRYEPHVVIVDLAVADGRGAEVARLLRRAAPTAKLVLLSGSGTMSVATAKRIGASALLPKRTRAAELVSVVRRVAAGDQIFPQRETNGTTLSRRQSQVLGLMAAGATNQEIAARLQLSPETVKQHAAAIYRKLGVRNRTQAARRGDALGLTTDEHADAAA